MFAFGSGHHIMNTLLTD